MENSGGGGSEGWVTKYGMASISRPNTIVVDHVEELEGLLEEENEHANQNGDSSQPSSSNNTPTKRSSIRNEGRVSIGGGVGGVSDPPPAEIPPGLLPELAREAALSNLATSLEYRHSIKRRIIVLFVYHFVLLTVAIGTWYIPGLNIAFHWVRSFWETDYFPWDSFALWEFMIVSGFLYVAFFVCGRANPLLSRSEGYEGVVTLPLIGGLVFLLGPIFAMSSSHNSRTASFKVTEDIFSGLGIHNDSIGFSVLYNYLFYILPFVIGLQYTYVENIAAVQRMSLHLHQKRWHLCTPFEVSVFSVYVLAIIAIVAFHAYLLAVQDIYLLFGYAIVYFSVSLVIYLVALAGAWDNQFSFVPHRYFVALALIPLTRFFNPISAALQALLAGIFVEAVGRWGFRWIYQNNDYQYWLQLYMHWLKRGRESSIDEEELVGQVLGRVF